MQPPQLTAYLRDQGLALRRQAEAAQLEATLHAERGKHKAEQKARQQFDYTAAIHDWFNSLPPAARQRRYAMDEFVSKFEGRYRNRPAVRLIAEALRKLGFVEKRDWSRAGRNRRYWQPPTEQL